MYHEEIIILGLSEIQNINYVFLSAMSSSVKTLLIVKCFGIKFYICSPPWQRSIFSLTGVYLFLSKVSVFSALPTEECFKFPISTYLSLALGFKEVLGSGLTSYLKGILPQRSNP